jgi:hypothetical protein
MKLASLSLALSLAVIACEPAQAPSRDVAPAPSQAVSSASAVPPEPVDPTCGGRLHALPENVGSTTPSDPLLPIAPLGAAAPDSPALKLAKGPAIDVGKVPVRIRSDHPRAFMDLSRIALDHDVVAAALPAPIKAHWDAWFLAQGSLRDALEHRAVAEQALHDCSACAERACLTKRATEAERDAGDATRKTNAELEALSAALEPASAQPSATPSVLLAYAWVLETKARANDEQDVLARDLARPIELYQAAADRSADDDAIGRAAKYFRATCLEDAFRAPEALAAWTTLAAAPGSELAAQALFHAGGLETDAAKAIATLLQARNADHSPRQLVALAATSRALGTAEDAGRWDDALEAALWLSRYPDVEDEVVWGVAEAIDALGGVLPAGASVPRRVFGKVAMMSATFAIERSDDARARRIWAGVVKDLADGPEAEVAKGELAHSRTAPSPKDVLRARLGALARSCHVWGSDADAAVVDVEATRGGVTFRGSADSDKALAACMGARKAWFLAESEAVPAFRARVVLEVVGP